MTRIDELQSKIAEVRTKLEAINTKVDTEKRVKSEQERTDFDNLLKEMQSFERELKDEQELQSRRIEAPSIITSEQKAKNRKYDSVKAINEFANGRSLTGYEADVQAFSKEKNNRIKGLFFPDNILYERTSHQALLRTAGISYANSDGLIGETASGLDIVAVPSVYETLGVTQLPNLTSVHKLNYGQGVVSDKVSEGSALSAKTRTKISDKIEPARFGHSEIISLENMSVASIINTTIADGDRACKAKISKELLDTIVAYTACTLTGYAVANSAMTMTQKILGALKASVLSAMFSKPGYAMGSTIYSELENTKGATDFKTIVDAGKLLGFNAYDVMTLMGLHDTNMYDIIFGDWARAYVGFFNLSGLELLINPYEGDDEGEVKFLFNRMADVSFNPYAFKVIRNAKLA
ncbi:MAG TPA: hypothetical protein VK179_19525 [Bacteroidales bacterium]|nr:hypothetical protein [Bacteroidales bacterium]